MYVKDKRVRGNMGDRHNRLKRAQGGLSVADGCRCLTKELDMIAC